MPSRERLLVDLHTHILPGVDDGATTLEEALTMARLAEADGVTTIVATPHVPFCRLHCAALRERLASFQRALDSSGIDIRLALGTETHLEPEALDWYAEGRACPIGDSSYVLVELPFVGMPLHADDVIFRLQVEGYRPILAHPERNNVLAATPSLLEPMVERGVLVQITSSGLLGHFGAGAQKAAVHFLQQGVAHILASDAHSATDRPPLLREAARRAESIIGERAWDLVSTTPAAILNGDWIEVAPPRSAGRSRRWP